MSLLHRYIYICHPTIAKTMCTIPNVNRAIAFLFVASLSVQTSRFFDTYYEAVSCQNEFGAFVPACIQKMAPWVNGFEVYYPLYFGFRIVFVNLGPCIALVILNLLLFWALKVSANCC